MLCGACNKKINRDGTQDTAIICCSTCSVFYHLTCLSSSRENLRQLRSNPSGFCCPACKEQKKVKANDTPPSRSLTLQKGPELPASKGPCDSKSAPDSQTPNFNPDLISSFSGTLIHLREAIEDMRKEMSAFTASLNATSEDMEQFRREIADMKRQLVEVDKYKSEVANLRAEVLELRREMGIREQRHYLKDIEITGITEQNGENIAHIVSTLTTTIGVELDPRDIDDVKRVGMRGGGQGGVERPRPVVVTFTRRASRDQFLKAAKVRRNITTDMIKVAGNPRKVYINEHLTKENRILFSKARSTGANLNFKFVWTSNGNIFMRKSETSSIVRVTSESVLDRLNENRVPHRDNKTASDPDGKKYS